MAEKYTQKHSGVAIFCGSAPCVFSDLEKAKELYPDATVYGANFVGAMIPEIEHVWTQHGELAHKIVERTGRSLTIHARPRKQKTGGGMWFLPAGDHAWQYVNYEWPDLYWVAGSSGIAGAMWAKHGMGHDTVIMCGVLLDPDSNGYADPYPGKSLDGSRALQKDRIAVWRDILLLYQQEGRTEGVYAMSGFPKEVLGAPDGIR